MLKVTNPIIPLDYPDPDIIRVGDTYYMVTTTMHFMPGCEILSSSDLVHWSHCTFVYDRLDSTEEQTLQYGKNSYGKGMWAACLRYHKGHFYVFFVANDTQKTYVYKAKEMAGPWEKSVMAGFYHDCSVLFDEDRVYIAYGNRDIWLTELKPDLSGPMPGGLHRLIISDQDNPNLGYEGAHLYKINGRYYVFLIHSHPSYWRRIQACYAANSLTDDFIGKDVLDDDRGYCNQGVAQGGIVDTPEGDWFAVLFQDHGAVGRLPILVPVHWENSFPVFGENGKVPAEVIITETVQNTSRTALVGSDDFRQSYHTPYGLSSHWQFNHEPTMAGFELNPETGEFSLKATTLSKNITEATNTLTQRMWFPTCQGEVTIDGSQLNIGDIAGLSAFQGAYGFVGITREAEGLFVIMKSRELNDLSLQAMPPDETAGKEWERFPLPDEIVRVRVEVDFLNMNDKARFYFKSPTGFQQIGPDHQLAFKMDHFTGCRFGLFYYATKTIGGTAVFSDFQYIRHRKKDVGNF